MLNISSLFLTLIVDYILILPVFIILKYFIVTTKIDAWVYSALQFVTIPANQETVFIAESFILLSLNCILWAFVFPYFPPTRYIQRKLMKFEQPCPKEYEKLNAALTYLEKQTGITKNSYNYFILRIPDWNACSAGANDIAITSFILRDFDEKQIAGILAHEIGHHRNFDIKIKNLCNGAAVLCLLCSKLLQILCFMLNLLRFIPFLGIITAFLSLVLALFVFIYNSFIMFPYRMISLFFARQLEYDADSYAVKIGMGHELLSSLHEFLEIEPNQNWWHILWSDHPRTKKRITAIEKKLHK